MKRRPRVSLLLRRAALVVSVLLFFLSVAGWTRSRWVGDELGFTWWRGSNGAALACHQIGFIHGGGDFGFAHVASTPALSKARWAYLRGPSEPVRQLMGGPV